MAVGNEGLLVTLAAAAATVGSLHSLAPDHWVPFAAVARAREWSIARTTRITVVCGFGHVTVSVLLGLLGLTLGREALEVVASRLQAGAGILVIAFGLTYAAWGLRRAAAERFHGHTHTRYDHVHDPSRLTAWGLFIFFSADPCVAVIPLFFAAAPLGASSTAAIIVVYEVATIATMVGLVLPARAGAHMLRVSWLGRYGDAAAGGLIAAVGLIVMGLG